MKLIANVILSEFVMKGILNGEYIVLSSNPNNVLIAQGVRT